jgi:hypothetical protein
MRRHAGNSGTVQLNDQSRKRLAGRGFDKPHVIHTNHAPPHYARHIEALGYISQAFRVIRPSRILRFTRCR